jgi:hypothetical protein
VTALRARPALIFFITTAGVAGLSSPASSRASDLGFEVPSLGPTTFQMTSTSILRFRGDNYDPNLNAFDDDFFSFYQRFDASLQTSTLRAELRLDTFVPFVDYALGTGDCPSDIEDDPRCYLDWDVRPERFVLRWQPTYQWTVEGGDTQQVFGRGVALSFRKVDLLGVDNAWRGAHVRYQGDVLRFRAHGGVANPQNQDPIDLRIVEDPDDIAVGGSVGARIPGSAGLTVNAQALRVWFENDDLAVATDRAVDVWGLTAEAPALAQGRLALYAEGNVMRRTEDLIDDPVEDFSRGVYGSAQLQLDKVTLLLEWKDYTNFLVAPSTLEDTTWRIYNAAPAVEFDGPQRLRGIGNQRGGGAQFDYAFLPGPWAFTLASVFYGFNEEPEVDPWEDGTWVTHSWVGVQRRPVYGDGWTWSFNATAGGRFEVFNHPNIGLQVEPGDLDRSIAHGQMELVLGKGDHSFDFTADHRFETQRIFGGDLQHFEIGGVGLTYALGWRFTAAVLMQWTDFQQAIVDRRAEKDYNFDGRLYPSLETRYSFTPGTFLNVFVGQTPGGQVCSGGICRDVPPYEGVNISFVARI